MNRNPQSSEVADTIPLRSAVRDSADSSHRMRLRAFDQTARGLFPEWIFPVQDEFRQAYRQSVVTGYETMRRQRVVIAGLARNVEHVLQRTMAEKSIAWAACLPTIAWSFTKMTPTMILGKCYSNGQGADDRVRVDGRSTRSGQSSGTLSFTSL
ncbi:MAG: hypothetical protein R3C28_22040 [Pirellulaceae bacterium]